MKVKKTLAWLTFLLVLVTITEGYLVFVNCTLEISEVTQTENISLNVSGDTRDSLKYNGPGKFYI